MERDPERSVERLVVFTDAVVAIAITLLVLPLAEYFGERPDAGSDDSVLLARLIDHLPQIGAFLLSFTIIARMWWAHHQVTRRLESFTTPLVVLDLVWTLTIVIVPVTTAAVPLYDPWPLSFGLYAGSLLLTSGALTGIAAIAHRDERVTSKRGDATRNSLIGIGVTTVAFAAALVLGLAIPEVHFFALWLLAFTPLLERPLKRRAARRAATA